MNLIVSVNNQIIELILHPTLGQDDGVRLLFSWHKTEIVLHNIEAFGYMFIHPCYLVDLHLMT